MHSFGNMAPNVDLSSELSKLKKEYLIDIILTKKIPVGVTVTQEVRDFIENNEKDAFLDSESHNHNIVEGNLQNVTELFTLRNELKILQTELKCAQKIQTGLEKTIGDKEVIIELLNRNQNIKYKQFTDEKINNVATLTEKSRKSEAKFELSSQSKSVLGMNNEPTTKKNIPKDTKETVKKPTITGTENSQGSFTSATRRAWLHVSRAGNHVKEEDIVDHLTKKFPRSEFHVQMQPKREDASSVSFKVGADFSLLDELNKPETWPEGIDVKRFRFFPRTSRRQDK